MWNLFITWYKKRFNDPHVTSLVAILLIFFVIIYFFHKILSPILIAVFCAYLLDWPTKKLQQLGFSRIIAVIVVMLIFIAIILLAIVVILPIVWQQGSNLIIDLPNMLTKLNRYLSTLPEKYPELVNVGIFDSLIDNVKNKIIQTGNSLFQFSIASILSLFTFTAYMIIIPLLIFFLLKDKDLLLSTGQRILPKHRELLIQVANEMDQQMSNYLVGKAIEIIIVTVVTFITFWYFGLSYALLLALGVGISLIIPYVGLFIITIPIVLIALFQWGIGTQFWYVVIAYFIIQLLDGNVLSPILYSEAVNLSPLVIMIALIIFGGLWGIWGAFFAIPLATLIKAIITSWPNPEIESKAQT